MMSRVSRLMPLTSSTINPNFRRINARSLFHQANKKTNFPIVHDNPPPEKDLNIFGQMREGCRILIRESKLWLQENKGIFSQTVRLVHPHCEDDVFVKFNSDAQCLNKWVTTCDSDYHLGFSKAKLELSPEGTGVFSGFIDATPPEDGVTKRAGLCNISTTPKLKSFMRETKCDWSEYNYLSLRIRGDGRPYLININTPDWYDLSWNDLYSYVLHTRGGPYWQYTKIPFSKFVFSSRGRVQDRQHTIQLDKVTTVNISADCKIEGPFRLEIDYIGLGVDYLEWEETAYEEYKWRLID